MSPSDTANLLLHRRSRTDSSGAPYTRETFPLGATGRPYHGGCMGEMSVPVIVAEGNMSARSMAKIPYCIRPRLFRAWGWKYLCRSQYLTSSGDLEARARETACFPAAGCTFRGSYRSGPAHIRQRAGHILTLVRVFGGRGTVCTISSVRGVHTPILNPSVPDLRLDRGTIARRAGNFR